MASFRAVWLAAVMAACGGGTPPLQTAEPGVVFTYPADQQLDVPLGTRVVVTFSERVQEGALGSVTIMGPSGPVTATPEIVGDGFSVQFADAQLEAGTTYEVIVGSAIDPTATNLPGSGPLFSFTTRAQRPKSVAPALVAVNGAPAATPDAYRPMLDSSTIRLVFSEPLDPRTTQLAAGAIEFVDGSGAAVPATVIAKGIHVAIDPVTDLTPGETYQVRLGNQLRDLGGQPVAPATVSLSPQNSGASTPIKQVLRTRQDGDPGPARSRAGGERNVIAIDKPLIGKELSTVLPAALPAELGDPAALGGPIAFVIRKGGRLAASGLDVKLGGQIPGGLSTGDILIEFLTDGGGRIFRNPWQDAEQRPENDRAPLYVDLSMDVAIYTVDPTGTAVISQIALGVQASGTAIATDGVLAIETMTSMELGLLGVTAAPSNLVLELITDESATPPTDSDPPTLIAMSPSEGSNDAGVGNGIELVFSEPVDLDRLRAGGIHLERTGGQLVPAVIESHGATIVLRPTTNLTYATTYAVVLDDIADVAGNPMTPRSPIAFTTPQFSGTGVPMTITAVHPGVPCALTAGDQTSPGHCDGGDGNDDRYRPFTLAANEPVEIEFSQPVNQSTVAHGTACGTGDVRIEELDGGGGCVRPVPGALIRRERGLLFVPDSPWAEGTKYRLVVITGGNEGCDGGELCGLTGDAASFDVLNGATDGDGGGGALSIDFVGAAPSLATYLFSAAGPFTDINGDGRVNAVEVKRDENRAAMRIVSTSGDISDASFTGDDCTGTRNASENCMFVTGAMPVQLGELTSDCGASGAPACIPVFLSPGVMYGTSVEMTATLLIDITEQTNTSVLRIREPTSGVPTGFIVDGGNGAPKMVVTLDLYLDAPDLNLPLSSHDLHSKTITVSLEGPVSFLPDGRIAIALANTQDVPIAINVDATLFAGAVNIILPANEMKLQLVSRPLRGAEP